MNIKIIDKDFSVCRVEDFSKINMDSSFLFIGKTDEELSVVCETSSIKDNTLKREDGWKAFRVEGPLDFSLIGIIAEISRILAENKIGIFVVSTYNTDYVLVKKEDFANALKVLSENGIEQK